MVRFAMSKPESTEGASAAADFRQGFAHENRLSILCCLAARETSVPQNDTTEAPAARTKGS